MDDSEITPESRILVVSGDSLMSRDAFADMLREVIPAGMVIDFRDPDAAQTSQIYHPTYRNPYTVVETAQQRDIRIWNEAVERRKVEKKGRA